MSLFNPNRRRLLLLAGCGLAGGAAAYTYFRGLRYPLLHFTAGDPVAHWVADGVKVTARGASLQSAGPDTVRFRAYAPEPELNVRGKGQGAVRIVIENLHPDARLAVDQSGAVLQLLDEERDKLIRTVTVGPAAGADTTLSWWFPKPERYRFAAVGDTGGGTELQWALKRASELGADFVIHVGDFYYDEGDVTRTTANLAAAAIPTYAAIGNHDFHNGWRALYPIFNKLIGPSSSVFKLGGVEFVSVDTAADFYPANRGRRARIVENLRPIDAPSGPRDRVVYTHKPLSDPDPERDYGMRRSAEVRWLREQLRSRGAGSLLAGHIHIKAEFDDQGLQTYITGQGLAHADLIVDRPYAEILIGDVEPGEPVRYQWQPMNMPFEAHCSDRNMKLLDELEKPEVKNRLLKLCGKV